MKATFESLSALQDHSFLVRRFDEKAFSAPYHYHPELELTLILKGEGKRYVGSNMSNYAAGDLVLLGSNLPHCWKSENIGKAKINASSLVIQFNNDFLGETFFAKPEMQLLKRLLDTSEQGICFSNRTAEQAKEKMMQLYEEQEPFKRMIYFLELLQNLAQAKQSKLLSKKQQQISYTATEQKRINDVMAYVVDNFTTHIILEDAAAIAGMTSTAFCKYFKRMTRKTFFETVLEYRIGYAMQQLVHTDKPVADIGYESGFGDVSHFYKTFKNQKQLSPLQYRKKFTSSL